MMSVNAKLGQVSEDSIKLLVDRFYAKVRRDPELAPVFLRAIPGDWGPHLAKMYAFWSSVMLTTGRYKGNPVVKHLALPNIKPALFERWLALFNETSIELFDDAVSAEFQAKAARIAESLQLALFYRPDRPWPPQAAT
jgi:hemoglobin